MEVARDVLSFVETEVPTATPLELKTTVVNDVCTDVVASTETLEYDVGAGATEVGSPKLTRPLREKNELSVVFYRL